jgi:NAD(P)-dependent dehydrogenase (short-subunit alcohol dehydrogenase family)
VLGVVCDVTKEDQVQNLISRAADFSDGRIDLLINNAGAGFGGCFVEPSTDSEITKILPVSSNQDWEKAFALNFYGALYGCRAVIPLMQAQGGGQIVNVISGIAFSPMAYQTRYAATKAALNALSLALRYEFWDDQIKVSSATPGTTATAIWGDLGAPESAQTAQQSAQRILTGVANNDRLILGDDGDVSGANYCFNSNPEAMAGNDTYLLDVARTRRSGKMVV